MTLKEYGPVYTGWTDAELKTAIDNRYDVRGITPMLNRRTMIRRLLETNRRAMFRFLDLPAELRNRVYEELFTFRPRKWNSESKACHPAILTTCRQAHKEATEILNDEREAEVCIALRNRELRASTGFWEEHQEGWGLDVEFKGAALLSTQIPLYCRTPSDTRYIKVEWPALLRRVRSILSEIDLRPINSDHTLFLGALAERGLTHSLYQLYAFLNEDRKAEALKVEITSALGSEFQLSYVLSPMYASAGIMNDTVFQMNDLSFKLQTEFKTAAAAFRKMHTLINHVASLYETNLVAYYHLVNELNHCERLLDDQYYLFQMYTYAESKTVQTAALEFEAAIKESANKRLEDLPWVKAAVIGRLQDERAAKRVVSEGDDQEQQVQAMQKDWDSASDSMFANILEW